MVFYRRWLLFCVLWYASQTCVVCLCRHWRPLGFFLDDGELDLVTWHHGECVLCSTVSSTILLPAKIPQLDLGCQVVLWVRLCVSIGAFPDVRWSPPVFGKRHIHSHPDFPQELHSTASSIRHLPACIEQHRCTELYIFWTVMFIVDVLSHNQIYGEDAILLGMKYSTYLIRQYHQNAIMEAPYIIAMIM